MKRFFKHALVSSLALLVVFVLVYFIFNFLQEPNQLSDTDRSKLGGTFIKLKDGYVRYELKGPDTGKVVILIHGAGSGYYAWDHNFEQLAAHGFLTLRYDLFGRGYSDRPDKEYNIQLFEDQLTELIDSLRLANRKISIVAVSMGATIAINHTVKNPSSVEHLVLVDPASLGMGAAPWYITKPVVSDLLFTFYWRPKAVDKQMKEFYDENAVKEYRTKTEEQMKYRGFKRAIRSTWEHTLGLNMSSHMREIAVSNVKTHLIWGKADPLIPYEASKEYLKFMPMSSLDIIERAGHLSNYEKPEEVNDLLFRFLANER